MPESKLRDQIEVVNRSIFVRPRLSRPPADKISCTHFRFRERVLVFAKSNSTSQIQLQLRLQLHWIHFNFTKSTSTSPTPCHFHQFHFNSTKSTSTLPNRLRFRQIHFNFQIHVHGDKQQTTSTLITSSNMSPLKSLNVPQRGTDNATGRPSRVLGRWYLYFISIQQSQNNTPTAYCCGCHITTSRKSNNGPDAGFVWASVCFIKALIT